MSAGSGGKKCEEENGEEDTHETPEMHTPLQQKMTIEELFIPKKSFSCIDSNLVLISLICFLADTVTDVFVCVEYFKNGHVYWGALTLTFVLGPSIIVQIFSARWYAADGNLTWVSAILHVLLLQPLERYVKVLMVGRKARSSQRADLVEQYYFRQNDVCMLRLFEAFLESAPQLTLQVYIMVATKDATSFTGISAAISLVALGWAMASYSHALRQAHRDDYRVNWGSLCLQTLWHLAMIAARVSAIVAFASVYKGWIFAAIGVHWWLMTIWTYLQNTDFCPSVWEERLFNILVGIVYCFCFFSLKEGRTRWRRAVFYSIMLVENLILIGMWFPYRPPENEAVNVALLVTATVGFVLGLALMICYYRWCHPSSPIYCWQPATPENSPRKLTKKPSLISSLQGELMPRHKSCIMLSRRSLLKSSANLKPQVEFKEAATPALLTPAFPRHLDPHRKVIDYDKTFSIEETGVFQHYSIDTSNCVRSIASKCAPYDFTGVDLSTISAVPCEGDQGDKQVHHETSPVFTEPNPVHQAPIVESGTTPPDTPFKSPLEYGCDFSAVTCSTPYNDLDKPRKLSVRGRKNIRNPNFGGAGEKLPDVVMEAQMDGVTPIHDVKSSPSSGIGSLNTGDGSEEVSKYSDAVCPGSCDPHHSNCACGVIGKLSPSEQDCHFVTADESLNFSHYDNVVSPMCPTKHENGSQKKPSPKVSRDQYQSTDSLERETALLRDHQTL